MFSTDLQIPILDLVIIVLYMLGILVVGILSTRHQKMTGDTYFLAGRSLGWVTVGAALFASNISTIHVVGLAASGYREGIVWGNFELAAGFTLIMLGLVFAPFYFRSRIGTLPEFLERRFSSGSRSFLAFMAILAAIFIHIGMSLYAGATVFEQFFGINVIASILIISVVTGIYTVLGGLKAVVITETIQTVVLIVGAVIVTFLAIMALPEHGITTMAEFENAVKPGQLNLLHTDNSVGLAWYAVLLGYPVMGIWYWCTDQTIVQRVLAAKSEHDAQIGPLFAGFIKVLPLFILVLPGTIGYVLFQDRIGDDANQVLPVLITELVPTGLKGLISAGLLAALMSTIAAALNSCGTLVAVDIVARIRPQTTDQTQVKIGRWSAVVIMLAAMAWSTQGGRFTSIFEAVQVLGADLAPPITAVFLWGIFWRRGTSQASLATLFFGLVLGVVAFVVDLPLIGDEKLLTNVWGIPFMLQAWWGFVICSVVFVAVSLLTPAPSAEKVDGLTWDNPLSVLKRSSYSGRTDPRIVAGALALTLILVYVLLR
ncbi:MAG: sodium:glucose symporter [Solibacterales bacterium]|nr:sodium:glucose symporter [Bryobacterales bacterium]|tara:strand:+ start:631 stop:2256 length:1626 start_codon:yes stop_codon:yes gene_type:complete